MGRVAELTIGVHGGQQTYLWANLLRDDYVSQTDTGRQLFSSNVTVKAGDGTDLEEVLAAYSGTRNIIVPDGDYYTDGLNATAPVVLKGAGINRSIIHLNDGVDTTLLKITGAGAGADWYNYLADFSLDGNKANNVSETGYGLHLYKSQRSLYERLHIYDACSHGIYVEGTGSGYNESVLNSFQFCQIYSCGETVGGGIYFTNYTPDNHVVYCYIGAVLQNGITCLSSGNKTIIGGHIWGSVGTPGKDGIAIASSTRDKIIGVEIEHKGEHGIHITGGTGGASRTEIADCTINGNSYQNVGNFDGVHIDATGAGNVIGLAISGNNCYDRESAGKSQRYGINIAETGAGITNYLGIICNVLYGNLTGGLNNGSTGANNEIAHNPGA